MASRSLAPENQQPDRMRMSLSTGRGDLGMEMADILFVLLCLANQTGIDMGAAFARGMAKRTSRDRERHAANPKLQ